MSTTRKPDRRHSSTIAVGGVPERITTARARNSSSVSISGATFTPRPSAFSSRHCMPAANSASLSAATWLPWKGVARLEPTSPTKCERARIRLCASRLTR
jgi:hypothetical protein